MQFGVLLTTALLGVGCGGSANTSPSDHHSSLAAAGAAGTGAHSECAIPSELLDAGPGACRVTRAYVQCTFPDGGGCLCLSDDPATCADCAAIHSGLSCQSKCAANEYAVSCGGPPRPDSTMYQGAPENCRAVGATPGGNAYACCPCQ